MRRIDRLFEIIQILRSTNRSITADEIAEQLEVSVRTIYRDIQALQSMRTPIDGEAGVGYMMRSGYDLPAINFSADEVEAIIVGLSMVSRTGDKKLLQAGSRVLSKIDTARERMQSFQVSDWGVEETHTIDPEILRNAIRQDRKLKITYRDKKLEQSLRTILPITMIYYIQAIVVVAWCELRKSFRHFRVDRILACEPLQQSFKGKGDKLRKQWQDLEE